MLPLYAGELAALKKYPVASKLALGKAAAIRRTPKDAVVSKSTFDTPRWLLLFRLQRIACLPPGFQTPNQRTSIQKASARQLLGDPGA